MDIKLSKWLIDELEGAASQEGISTRAYIKKTLQDHIETINSTDQGAYDSKGVNHVYSNLQTSGTNSGKESD